MTKLCPRGKAAAKRKFKVYPSAYANAYARKICAGKIKEPSGVKRKEFRGPKPAAEGAMINKPKKLMGGGPAGFLSIFKKKDKPKQVKEENNKPANKKKKRLEELKKEIDNLNMGGVAKTAGAQSAMGRLEKSGMKLVEGGPAGTFGRPTKRIGKLERAIRQKRKLDKIEPYSPDRVTRNVRRKNMGRPISSGMGSRPASKPPERPTKYDKFKEFRKKKKILSIRDAAKQVVAEGGSPSLIQDEARMDRMDKLLGIIPSEKMMAKGGELKAGPKPETSPKTDAPQRKIKIPTRPGIKKKKRKGFELKYPGPARPGNPVVAYEVRKGGLTSKLNNPAKGYNKGGNAKIKKVIKGLNKASALHKGQAKTLGTLVNKKAVGGMADYYKDLM